jgi:sirohydrochlorin ferrochelatase
MRRAGFSHLLHRASTGREIVEVAHMEICRPSIDDAVDRCAEAGASHVIIAPYFLSR